MARIVNAQHSKFVGTARQLADFFRVLQGQKSAIVDVRFSTFAITAKPIGADAIARVLRMKSRGTKARTPATKRKSGA